MYKEYNRNPEMDIPYKKIIFMCTLGGTSSQLAEAFIKKQESMAGRVEKVKTGTNNPIAVLLKRYTLLQNDNIIVTPYSMRSVIDSARKVVNAKSSLFLVKFAGNSDKILHIIEETEKELRKPESRIIDEGNVFCLDEISQKINNLVVDKNKPLNE